MPFTLAHPAAILPLRRFCPRFCNFPALVFGSIAPDAGYCFGSPHMDDFSHSLVGSIEFCLPVGAIMLGFFYGLRLLVVEKLPDHWRKILEPFCRRPIGSPLIAVASLLVGIWIHLLLDSFTHKNGWLVENFVFLQTSVFSVGDHDFKIFNLLWYLLSFAGITWLYFAWELWENASAEIRRPLNRWKSLGTAAFVGFLMLPVGLAHHLVHGPWGLCLTAILSGAILIGLALKIGNKQS
jgi:hypothetical protein